MPSPCTHLLHIYTLPPSSRKHSPQHTDFPKQAPTQRVPCAHSHTLLLPPSCITTGSSSHPLLTELGAKRGGFMRRNGGQDPNAWVECSGPSQASQSRWWRHLLMVQKGTGSKRVPSSAHRLSQLSASQATVGMPSPRKCR